MKSELSHSFNTVIHPHDEEILIFKVLSTIHTREYEVRNLESFLSCCSAPHPNDAEILQRICSYNIISSCLLPIIQMIFLISKLLSGIRVRNSSLWHKMLELIVILGGEAGGDSQGEGQEGGGGEEDRKREAGG